MRGECPRRPPVFGSVRDHFGGGRWDWFLGFETWAAGGCVIERDCLQADGFESIPCAIRVLADDVSPSGDRFQNLAGQVEGSAHELSLIGDTGQVFKGLQVTVCSFTQANLDELLFAFRMFVFVTHCGRSFAVVRFLRAVRSLREF